jgi:hypothetical protein
MGSRSSPQGRQTGKALPGQRPDRTLPVHCRGTGSPLLQLLHHRRRGGRMRRGRHRVVRPEEQEPGCASGEAGAEEDWATRVRCVRTILRLRMPALPRLGLYPTIELKSSAEGRGIRAYSPEQPSPKPRKTDAQLDGRRDRSAEALQEGRSTRNRTSAKQSAATAVEPRLHRGTGPQLDGVAVRDNG